MLDYSPCHRNLNVSLLLGGAFYLVDDTPTPPGEVSTIGEFVKSYGKEVVLVSALRNVRISRLTSIYLSAQTTPAEALNVFSLSGLRVVFSVSSGTDSVPPPTLGGGKASLYLLERPQASFSPLPSLAPFGVPMLDDWRALWAAWDLVTLGMIPEDMLHQKPIDLRHKCLFYIGHIPTSVRSAFPCAVDAHLCCRFLDMLMSSALGEPNTEPKQFTRIFEVGCP